MRVRFSATDGLWPQWRESLRRACPDVVFANEGHPAEFDAILYAPGGDLVDFTPYVNVRLVQSLWAGIEKVVTNPTLSQPLARMVDPSLSKAMAEYCLGWAMRAHLRMDAYHQDGLWRDDLVPPLAGDRQIVILGAGVLGQEVARALSQVGFRILGVSRTGHAVPGLMVTDDVDSALKQAEILISLLPQTPATIGLLDQRRLALLPQGAWLINPGRGGVIVQDALLAALDHGPLAQVVLDVFPEEPLPFDHPYWGRDDIYVTPHIAARTRPETAALVVARNLRCIAQGQEPAFLVNRSLGY